MKRYLGAFLPGILSVALFGIAVFWLILPQQEQAILSKKREMIRELTTAAISLVASYEQHENMGLLSREEAQLRVLHRLRHMRFGPEGKDYFFVLNTDLRMLVHPYRLDLEGQDVSGFADPQGKFLFQEMLEVVRQQDEGEVSYLWQWKDDSAHMATKLSHVVLFQPWGWIIGSGIYTDDVKHEMGKMTRQLTLVGAVVMVLVSLLAAYISWRNLQAARAREQALADLRESEERFRGISDNALDGIVMMDTQGRISFWNRAAENILGYSRQEALGLDMHLLISPQRYHDSYHQAIKAFQSSGQGPVIAQTLEMSAIRRDGQEIPVELSVASLNLRGQWHAVGIIRDISQRRRDEQELRQKAEELTALNALGREINAQLSLEHASRAALQGIREALRPDMIFLFLREGDNLTLQAMEPSTPEGLGEFPGHKVGQCLCGLAVSQDRALFSSDIERDPRCAWQECRQAGFRSFAALPLRHGQEVAGVLGLASRQERDFARQAEFMETLASQVSVALANARLFEAAKQELAERRRAEVSLKASEDRFRTLSEKSPLGISLNGQDGVIQYLNPAFVDIFGYDLRDIPTRQDWFRLAYPDENYRRGVMQAWQKDSARRPDGAYLTRTLRVACKDGGSKIIFFRTVALPSGEELRLYEDITQRTLAQEELRKSEATLKTIMQASPSGIAMLSYPERRVLWANQRLADICGYPLSEMFGLQARSTYRDQEEYDRVGRLLSQIGQTDGLDSFETQWVRQDGGLVDVLLNVSALNPANLGEGVVFTALDITQHKQAQEEVKRSEATLRGILHASPSGIAMLSYPERKVLWANDRLFEMTGYSREEVIGRPGDYIYRDPQEFSRVARLLRQGVQLSGAGAIETQWVRKDGLVIDVLINIAAIIPGDPSGGLVFNALDITASKQAQEEVKRSEATLRGILQVSPSAIAMVSYPERLLVWTNQGVSEMTGYAPEEYLGKQARPFYASEEEFMRVGRQATDPARASQVNSMESQWRRKDGQIIDVLIQSAPLNPEDLSAGLVFVTQDITEYKRAHERIRQNEEKYRLILEATPDPVVLYDMEGRVLYLNPAFTRVFGWTLEELAGRGIDYVPQEEQARTREMLDLLHHGQSVHAFETKRLTKQGGKLDISLSWSVWTDEAGKLVGSVVVLRDVTEQKKVVAQLEQARKMEAIGNLAGGIAHDFNNVLQAISGNVQLILIKSELEGPARERLKGIDNLTQRAAEMIKQLLTLSRKQEISLKPLDLNQEITHVCGLLERIIPKMISLENGLAPDLRPINGDAAQLEQIILNLASNAVDAMPQGGKLIFSTENMEVDEVFSRSHPELKPGAYVLFQVRDTGPGMDQETLEHIFEPFFTTKLNGKGTGLGLATVYGIVDRHQGLVTCYSLPGRGTIFNIYLPALAGAAGPADSASAFQLSSLHGGQETILLVDDEEAILKVGREMLGMYGYEVLTAKSGEEALALYQERAGRVSLVILDLNMPGMGGQRCLQTLLALDPAAKVVISSGYQSPDMARSLEEAGAKGFIGKPYRLTDLVQRVRQILDAAQA